MNAPQMKNGSALFLQIVIVLFGIGILGFLLWEPQVEGRNVHATMFEIYGKDPFLAYVYLGSIPFFIALFRAFGLVQHVRQTGSFSQVTLNALRAIQRCAIVLLGFIVGGAIIILLVGDKDDRPAGFFMSLLIALPTLAVAVAAAKWSRNLRARLSLPSA